MSSTSKAQNLIGYIIDGTSAFCSLTGITIFKIISVIYPMVSQYKSIFYAIIILFIILRYQRHVIPRYQIEMQDKPEEEAKSSFLTSALIIILFSIPIIVQCVNLHKNSIDALAHNSPNIENYDENIYNEENLKNYEDNTLTPLDKMIEEYILYSENTIIPIDELETLSDDELYYIRNGIFAYVGKYYKSGYYDKFSWYNGDIVDSDDIWNKINEFQLKNINNIKLIENQRKVN